MLVLVLVACLDGHDCRVVPDLRWPAGSNHCDVYYNTLRHMPVYGGLAQRRGIINEGVVVNDD